MNVFFCCCLVHHSMKALSPQLPVFSVGCQDLKGVIKMSKLVYYMNIWTIKLFTDSLIKICKAYVTRSEFCLIHKGQSNKQNSDTV